MNKGVQWPGTNPFAAQQCVLRNKKGSTISKGQVAAVDITNSAGLGLPECLGAAVAVAAANIDGIIVVANEDVANGELGTFTFWGPVQAFVDGGTLDVTAGDKLIPAAASTSFTRSDATTDVVAGSAMEDNTGAAALKWVFLKGDIRPDGTDESP